jgi:hypothetical protein
MYTGLQFPYEYISDGNVVSHLAWKLVEARGGVTEVLFAAVAFLVTFAGIGMFVVSSPYFGFDRQVTVLAKLVGRCEVYRLEVGQYFSCVVLKIWVLGSGSGMVRPHGESCISYG